MQSSNDAIKADFKTNEENIRKLCPSLIDYGASVFCNELDDFSESNASGTKQRVGQKVQQIKKLIH
jgi:hypothetical protein